MFAKVIVDVPARETNRPYDYQVPDSLKTWVAIGSRVAVSFGSRTLQGIVVGLSTNSDTDVEKIKPIQQVLDTVPPLTEELVELAKWMSETYICHELSALQAMLPSALKAKYEKILVPADQHIGAYNEGQLDAKLSEAESQWLKILIEKGSMTLAEAQRHFAGQESVILSLLHKGYITEIQNVRDRLSVKRTLYVRPALSTEELQRMASTCSVQAKRQKQVLEYFIQNPDSITKKQLLEHLGISSSTIQTMVTKGWLKLEQRETYRDPYDSRKFTRTKALPTHKAARGSDCAYYQEFKSQTPSSIFTTRCYRKRKNRSVFAGDRNLSGRGPCSDCSRPRNLTYTTDGPSLQRTFR